MLKCVGLEMRKVDTYLWVFFGVHFREFVTCGCHLHIDSPKVTKTNEAGSCSKSPFPSDLSSYFYLLIFPSPCGFQNTYQLFSLLGGTSSLSFLSWIIFRHLVGLCSWNANILVCVYCIFALILPHNYKQTPCHIHCISLSYFAETQRTMNSQFPLY